MLYGISYTMNMTKYWIVACAVLVLALGGYLYSSIPPKELTPTPPAPPPSAVPTTLRYENAEFGFVVTLPENWKGHLVVRDGWVGELGGKTIATGTKLSIRHPLWTTAKPRQDIPVLVFTSSQWTDLASEKFHVGAAPISPTELGRNTNYVFALPARYNFAFPEGFEEVRRSSRGSRSKVFNALR
jgi:hypothetical protein